MRKLSIRTLFLIGALMDILSEVLLETFFFPSLTDQSLSTSNIILLVICLIFMITGFVLMMISWIRALVLTAKLAHWGWFVCLLVFNLFALFAYVFFGPKALPKQA